MPKLLLFVPCQKVLIDQDNTISTVSIIQEMWLEAGATVPPDFQAAVRWDVVTLWFRLPEDDGRTFEQVVMLLTSDGTMTSHTKLQFSMSTPFHRTLSYMYGFQVGQPGTHHLELKLKDMANESSFIQEHTFPMLLNHRTKPETGRTA